MDVNNVDYRFLDGPTYFDVGGFNREHFDLIIVDGNYRTKCIDFFHPILKVGGYLYLDNAD